MTLVSTAQGLPASQLDFTRMSDRKLRIVSSHMLVSGAVDVDTAEALAGLLQVTSCGTDAQGRSTPVYSDEPVNRFAQLRDRIDYDLAYDSIAAPLLERRALALIKNMYESTGVDASYAESADMNTTVRPQAATASLKEAVDAFRKEASMTPVQRTRRDVLKSMKITEDDLRAMSADVRKATERRILEEVVVLLKKREQAVPSNLQDSRPAADAVSTHVQFGRHAAASQARS